MAYSCGLWPFFSDWASYCRNNFSWLESHENLQSDVKKYVFKRLRLWDITRDIPWGKVPVPGSNSENKVFYGWFDNHLAYISTAVKLLESKGYDGAEFWNSSDIYHFIGKDIVYHHYLFLPAVRMGLGETYKLPDYIPTRGHLTLQSRKIFWYRLKEFLKYYPSDHLACTGLSIQGKIADNLQDSILKIPSIQCTSCDSLISCVTARLDVRALEYSLEACRSRLVPSALLAETDSDGIRYPCR